MQVKRRRLELLRVAGWKLVVGTVCWFAVVILMAAGLYPFLGRDGSVFALGVGVGAYTVMVMTAAQLIDPVGARLYNGLDAEISTARELHRMRRDGWVAVHNLHFAGGDVDHVAVGPGGVVVIETKSSTADWAFLERNGDLDRWADQATRGAFRVNALIRQHAGVSVEPLPVVVAWLPGSERPTTQLTKDAALLTGRELRSYLAELPPVLDPATIDTVSTGLEHAGQQFSEANGIRQPGRVRRLLGIGTYA